MMCKMKEISMELSFIFYFFTLAIRGQIRYNKENNRVTIP